MFVRNFIQIICILITLWHCSFSVNELRGQSNFDTASFNNKLYKVQFDSIPVYFPYNGYIRYKSDAFDTFRLKVYSHVLYSADEPINYPKENGQSRYFRFILIDSLEASVYRMEQANGIAYIIHKKLKGKFESSYDKTEEDSILLSVKDFNRFWNQIVASDIWRIKPYNTADFAWSNSGIIVFESNQHGGYCLTDIYKPFTIKKRGFRTFYKALLSLTHIVEKN